MTLDIAAPIAYLCSINTLGLDSLSYQNQYQLNH